MYAIRSYYEVGIVEPAYVVGAVVPVVYGFPGGVVNHPSVPAVDVVDVYRLPGNVVEVTGHQPAFAVCNADRAAQYVGFIIRDAIAG